MVTQHRYSSNPNKSFVRIALNKSNIKTIKTTIKTSRFTARPLPAKSKSTLKVIRLQKSQLRKYYGHIKNNIYSKIFNKMAYELNPLESFVGTIERRFDSVLARLGFAQSFFLTKQRISHGAFLVNGRRISHPNFYISKGDLIQLSPKYLYNYTKQFMDYYSHRFAHKSY